MAILVRNCHHLTVAKIQLDSLYLLVPSAQRHLIAPDNVTGPHPLYTLLTSLFGPLEPDIIYTWGSDEPSCAQDVDGTLVVASGFTKFPMSKPLPPYRRRRC